MKQKLLLIILVSSIVFLGLSGTVQANLFTNASFEEGDFPGDYPDAWTGWTPGTPPGTIEWIDSTTAHGVAHQGTKMVALTPTAGDRVMFYNEGWADMLTEFGRTYWVSFWGKAGAGETSSSTAFKYEWHMEPNEPPGLGDIIVENGPAVSVGSSWERHLLNLSPPDTGHLWLRYVFNHEHGNAAYLIDNLYIASYCCSGPSWPYNPDPDNRATGVSTSLTRLSWERLEFNGRKYDVEVWWGKQDDPNFWYVPGEAQKLMELSDANDIDLSSTLIGDLTPLEKDKHYYWKLKYEDPNDGNFGAGLKEAPTWIFDTIGPAFDINGDGDVDLGDLGILSSQWQGLPGTPSADIAPAGGDNFVDMQDLKLLAENWLWPM